MWEMFVWEKCNHLEGGKYISLPFFWNIVGETGKMFGEGFKFKHSLERYFLKLFEPVRKILNKCAKFVSK